MWGTPSELDRIQYGIERPLADRLRSTPKAERVRVYGEVYDELFRRFADHTQLKITSDQRAQAVQTKLRFVSRYLTPTTCLMEIGAGDCAFSIAAAALVARAIAVDVSRFIASKEHGADNFELIISDGTTLPVPSGSIDVAYSDQLMEHLHPDDARAQLDEVARILRPGGTYICITPNRLTGPHDCSRDFDEVATGFHLREYTARELRAEFLSVGFSKVQLFAGGRGHYVRMPSRIGLLLEDAFASLPWRFRVRARESIIAYALFGVTAVATKR